MINPLQGIVYKVSCHDCAFAYIREGKCSWSLHGAKHDAGHASNSESTIKQHAESRDHNIHPRDTQILKHGVTNNHERLFLESWHFTLDRAAVNKRKPLPCVDLPLIQNQ